MDRIRVLVAELPAMLRDVVVRLLEAEGDMDVVAPSATEALPAQVVQQRPRVVVLGLRDGKLSPLGRAILQGSRRMKVLGISQDGRRAVLFQLRPHASPLGEVSPEGLVRAIRGAVGKGWTRPR